MTSARKTKSYEEDFSNYSVNSNDLLSRRREGQQCKRSQGKNAHLQTKGGYRP